jgi:hypothetical protein
MIKAARVFLVLGMAFVLIGGVSVYFTLTTGDKMMAQAASAGGSEKVQEAVEKAKAQIADLKEHLPLRIGELALSLAAGVIGFAGTKMRKRGPAFFILEALCLALTVVALVSKSYIVAALYLLGLALGFIQIMKLTKGGAIIPEE